MGSPCVLVDVDGTLLGGFSTEARFLFHLVRRGKFGLAQFVAAAWFTFRWLPLYGRHVAKKNKAYLAGLPAADVAAEAEEFVNAVLHRILRPEILERLSAHRAQGHTIVLLTGTPDFIARPLARLVGAVDICATHCARCQDCFAADPPLQHPFGQDKLTLAQQICRDRGTTLAECTAYADSIHDLPLLLKVGQPVAAWPDRALASIARQGQWLILPHAGPARGRAPAGLARR